MRFVKGFFMAWGNFCSVPCPYRPWDDSARKHMLAMLPVLGLAMGAVWYLIAKVLLLLGLPAPVTAVLLTVYPFLVSGCMHLDGFMDCSDAIGSRAPREKKLEILKDSHVGAFAVIWLAIAFLLSFAGMWSWVQKGDCLPVLILIPMASRTVSVINVMHTKRLKTSQYSDMDKDSSPFEAAVLIMFLVAMAVFAIAAQPKGLIVLGLEVLVSEIAVMKGRRQLGGMSGDISGYGIVWGETLAVVLAACIL